MSNTDLAAPTVHAPPEPIFIGLDLSLASTGVASIHGDVITVRRVVSKPTRGTTADGAARLDKIVADIFAGIPLSDDTHVAMEGPSYGSVGTGQHIRGGLWWLVRTELARASIDTIVVAPSTLKKYATGKGNATKDAVMLAAARRYPQVDLTGNDEADALVLAAIAARIGGYPIDLNLPVVQVEAALKVTR